MKVVMSAENSQKKIQIALELPANMDRAEMARNVYAARLVGSHR